MTFLLPPGIKGLIHLNSLILATKFGDDLLAFFSLFWLRAIFHIFKFKEYPAKLIGKLSVIHGKRF